MQKGIILTFSGILCVLLIASGCAKKEESTREGVPAQKETFQVAEKTEVPQPSGEPITEERVLFSFEKDTDGFEIPFWALEKDDHVAKSIAVSAEFASEGGKSLKVESDFPGQKWTAALVELEQYLDLSPYREISVDIYLPKNAPLGLRAKLILTVGEGWKFTEMTRSIPLVPGEWTKVYANIEPGSYDWKRIVPDESFRRDVRKIVVRVESNKRPVYKGPIYVDNIRIGK